MTPKTIQLLLVGFFISIWLYSRIFLWRKGYDVLPNPFFRRFKFLKIWRILRQSNDFYDRLFSFLSLICIPVAITVFFLFVPYLDRIDFNYYDCIQYDNFLSIKFEGVVIDKGIDTINHNNKYIVLPDSNTNRNRIYEHNLYHLYDSISLGDIIVKRQQSDTIFIFRNGISKFYKIEIYCDSVLLKLK